MSIQELIRELQEYAAQNPTAEVEICTSNDMRAYSDFRVRGRYDPKDRNTDNEEKNLLRVRLVI
jgi:hypothetical protein